jgi:hypothetical protein
VPFFWALIWAVPSTIWARRDMHLETITWEMDHGIDPDEKRLRIETPSTPEPTSDNDGEEAKAASPNLGSADFSRGRDEAPKPDLESKREAPSPEVGPTETAETTNERKDDIEHSSAAAVKKEEVEEKNQDTPSPA